MNVVLRNNTNTDLHNASLFTRVVVSQARMDAYEENYKNRISGPVGLMSLGGIEVGHAVAADKAILAYDRIDKIAPVFVPIWRKGESLEFSIARIEDVTLVAESLNLWIGADEGTEEVALSVELARRILAKNVQPSAR